MTTRPYELLARFGEDGNVSGVSVRTITSLDGKDYESDPKPLADETDPAFIDFATQFSAKAVAERDSLKIQLAEKTTEAETLTADKTQLTEQVATLEQQVAALNATVAEQASRIESLLTEVPFDPRVLDATAFLARIRSEEIISLAGSADANVQQIVGMLVAYRDNDWPIVLDSPEMQQSIPLLVSLGLLTQSRATELLRDGTRSEAYVAGE